MEINKNNYEAYFVDYLEGNLDSRFVDDFIEFLQQNPNLKEELTLFELIKINSENVLFNKKENLIREKLDSEKEFDKLSIADLEGDVSVADKSELEDYITKHPRKKRDVALMNKTKLLTDETILFNKKKKLYRYSAGRNFLIWTGRIAAVLIIAFAFYTLLDKSTPELKPVDRVAKLEEKKVITPKLKQIPVETKQEDIITENKVSPKPVIKENTINPERKVLREDRQENPDVKDKVVRDLFDIPTEMSSITASLKIAQPHATMATMYITIPPNSADYYEEKLLVDVVKERTGIDKFKFNRITKAGLNLVSNISKDKFKYETDSEGKIIEYRYNSRLLAFSIPSKRTKPE